MKRTVSHRSAGLILFFTVLAAATWTPAGATSPLPRPLARFAHRDRLLLIFSPDNNDSRWLNQREMLSSTAVLRQLADRNTLRVDIFATHPTTQSGNVRLTMDQEDAIRRFYNISPLTFYVLLIGKDCHIAGVWNLPVRPEQLERQIDSMPMRRQEMRERGR